MATESLPAGFKSDPDSEVVQQMVREIYEWSGEAERMNEQLQFLDPSLNTVYEEFYGQAAERIQFADDDARARYFTQLEQRQQQFRERFMATLPMDAVAFDAVVGIYAELFTEAELEQLVDFMRSPVGKKFAGRHAEMFRYTVQYVQGRVFNLMRERLPDAQAEEFDRLSATWTAGSDP